MERRVHPTTHTENMKNESKKTLIKESRLPEAFVYSGSVVIEPKESPTEISDKISKMMPDMGIIRATGIIKNTESFKESKQILGNFRSALQNAPSGTFDEHKPDYSIEKQDDTRPALEKAVDSLETVVRNMLKAGIEVPSVYKDFLHVIRPYEPPQELQILNQPPLFKITGVDENGEVIVKTDTPVVLKQGKTEIALTHEKLTDTVSNSQKINCKSFRELHNWVKQNVHRAGSLEKLSDEEWINLRDILIKNHEKSNEFEKELVEESTNETKVKIEVPPSVNMNAYEIRNDILKSSINSVNQVKGFKNLDEYVKDVLFTANKFYEFVENKRFNQKIV